MGTDGLFDNLYTEEIQKIIKAHLKSGVNTIASQLTFRAFKRSYSKNRCPFQDRMSSFSSTWQGGKKDDITVIVSIIQSE
jgi:serine/threonine protein phosphatase PrpC